MQSKTFCFNLFHKGLLRKNFGRFWPLMLIYTLFLLLFHPFILYMNSRQLAYVDLTQAEILERQREYFFEIIGNMPDEVFIMIGAFALVLAVFSYLYNTRFAYSLHAFPLTRVQLFATNVLTALLMLVLPQFLNCLILNLLVLSFDAGLIGIVWIWFVNLCAVDLFFVGFASFIVLFAGQAFSATLFYGIWNFLYLVLVMLINTLMDLLVYGFQGSVMDYSSPLCPIWYMVAETGYSFIYINDQPVLEFNGALALVLFAIAGIVFLFFGLLVYQKRKLERAGDFITVDFAKPLFRWGAAIVLAISGALVMYSLTTIHATRITDAKKTVRLVLWVIPFAIFVFFAAEMFIKKSFRVFRREKWMECGVMTAVIVGAICFIGFDFIHVAGYVPKRNEIEAVALDNYNVILRDHNLSGSISAEEMDELIDQTMDLHETIVEHRQEIQKVSESVDFEYPFWINIRYYLKNGRSVSRAYWIPQVPKEENEAVADVYDQFLALSNKPVVMKYRAFGQDYENAEISSIELGYYKRTVESPDSQGDTSYEYSAMYLDQDAVKQWKEQLHRAILDDMDEGTVFFESGEATGVRLGISYYYHGSNGSVYNDYSDLNITERSRHTVDVLIQMGAISSADELKSPTF